MKRKKLSREAREELLDTLRDRYAASSKTDKGRIPDEFVAISGHNRSYASRLLNLPAGTASSGGGRIASRRVYGQAVREALTVLWEASDRLCSKRLRAILPTLIGSLEAHGHLQPDPDLKDKLLAISPASIDRVLRPVRERAAARRRAPRRRNQYSRSIPVRTFADWHEPPATRR